MEIKRGYVKWTDSEGVFHKELLKSHPDLYEEATEEQKLAADEAAELSGYVADQHVFDYDND